MTVLVVNPKHMKAVPGRKTDVKDAEWIADLMHHGLLRESFIPDRPQRELRELMRYRRTLIRQRAQVIQRIQKVLEGANIKLSSEVTKIVGASGRAMLEALADGNNDVKAMADLAQGKLCKKRPALEESLNGLMGPHQQLMLKSQLRDLDFMDEEIAQMDEEVANRVRPLRGDNGSTG